MTVLQSAAEKLERAVSLHPRDFAVVYNAARAQLALARALKATDAAPHLATAADLFQRAITYGYNRINLCVFCMNGYLISACVCVQLSAECGGRAPKFGSYAC